MAKKSWIEKRDTAKDPYVVLLDKPTPMAPVGARMLIPSPLEIDLYIRAIPKGHFVDPVKMRADLAEKYDAAVTCPLTSGIFLRIVACAALDEYRAGKPLDKITPFWRVISEKNKIIKKLDIDAADLARFRALEG